MAVRPPPLSPAVRSEPGVAEAHRRTADRVFFWSLVYTAVITLAWLFYFLTQRDGGLFFRRYDVDAETVQRLIGGFLFFWVLSAVSPTAPTAG